MLTRLLSGSWILQLEFRRAVPADVCVGIFGMGMIFRLSFFICEMGIKQHVVCKATVRLAEY